MARVSLSATRGQSLGNGAFNASFGEVSSTAVGAAVAVLVADGASPTQAHVTTLNNAWTAFQGTNAVLDYDDSVITTQAALKAVLNQIYAAALARGLPT